jgi:hypothetical protein
MGMIGAGANSLHIVWIMNKRWQSVLMLLEWVLFVYAVRVIL